MYVNPFSIQIYKINPHTNVKQNMHTQTSNIFLQVSLFHTVLVENKLSTYKAKTGWYQLTIPSDLLISDFFKEKKKATERNK